MQDVFEFFIATVLSITTILLPTKPMYEGISLSSAKPSISFGKLPQPSNTRVLGVHTIAPIVSPTTTVEPTPIKKTITVAVIGDSMVDTLGPGIPTLQKTLTQTFPLTSFKIKNYGVGATNIEYGIMRITNGYRYKDMNIPPLVASNADIVVIESFAYNPFPYPDGALERHWDSLSKMVDVISKRLPKAHIIIATTIAPDEKHFGDGAAGLAFDDITKQFKTYEIKTYLENTIKFARFKGLPLADAYTPSQDATGNGNPLYISLLDHIHPSEKGAELFAKQIAETILTNKILE